MLACAISFGDATGMQYDQYEIDGRSASFRWQPTRGPYRRVSESQAQSYNDQGGFVLEDAFSAEEIATVLSALDDIAQTTNELLAHLPEGQPSIARKDEIVFSPHVVTQHPVLRSFSCHPVFRDLTHDLIGAGARLYWDQLVYKIGQTPDEFPWHQDNGYTFVEPQQYLTCWVALTDATIDNGCPWIVPGVHRRGTLKHRWTDLGFECLHQPDGAMPMPAKAGSVVVFSSLTPHRTGANETANTRKAYILQYAPDGAVMHPRGGDPTPANNPDWQYEIENG